MHSKLGSFVQYTCIHQASYIGNSFSPIDSIVFVDPCGLEALANSALTLWSPGDAFGEV